MSERPVKLVCFDLGGVVVRICRSWAEGCRRAGLDVRGDVNVMRAGGWDALNAEYQTGRIGHDTFCERFSALISGLYAPDEIRRVHRGWLVGEYEGVAELVDRLHGAGLESAVLSNTCAVHWEQLSRYPAFARMRNRLGSHLLGLRKPEAAAYRAVESHTGCAGGEIVFFDDDESNVAGARAVGWRAERIDHAGAPAAQIERALAAHGVAL